MAALISVIVPIYNSREHLAECLESIRHQTFKNFEVVLVDDGSTDDSGDICDRFCRVDSRFMKVRTENKGVSSARNTGLSQANGLFVTFVDSDDIVHPEFLEILYFAMGDKSETITATGFEKFTVASTKVSAVSCQATRQIDARSAVSEILYQRLENGICGKLIPTLLLGVNPFPYGIKIGEDLITLLNTLNKAKELVYVSTPLYYYRQQAGSAIHTGEVAQHLPVIDWFNEQLAVGGDFPKNALQNRRFMEAIFATLEADFVEGNAARKQDDYVIRTIKSTRELVVKDSQSRLSYRILAGLSFLGVTVPALAVRTREDILTRLSKRGGA
ncbi:glycosyltransferase family 2 protein [Corynebacterium glucuronolyticum]